MENRERERCLIRGTTVQKKKLTGKRNNSTRPTLVHFKSIAICLRVLFFLNLYEFPLLVSAMGDLVLFLKSCHIITNETILNMRNDKAEID